MSEYCLCQRVKPDKFAGAQPLVCAQRHVRTAATSPCGASWLAPSSQGTISDS
jgi:hypothetical protein